MEPHEYSERRAIYLKSCVDFCVYVCLDDGDKVLPKWQENRLTCDFSQFSQIL